MIVRTSAAISHGLSRRILRVETESALLVLGMPVGLRLSRVRFAQQFFGGGEQNAGGETVDRCGDLVWRGKAGCDSDVSVMWVSTVRKGCTSARHGYACALGELHDASRRTVDDIEADEVPSVRIGPGRALVVTQ